MSGHMLSVTDSQQFTHLANDMEVQLPHGRNAVKAQLERHYARHASLLTCPLVCHSLQATDSYM